MVMTEELVRLDATAQADLVKRGEVTPAELVEAAIARIEATNGDVNAVIHPLFEEGLEAARGELPEGPFRGVPFLLKDLGAAFAGQPLHLGMSYLKELDFRAPMDTYLAQRFRAAGLVTIGKTNAPELGILPTTEPRAHGATHNPWDLGRTAGGSSGGSAAAVAAGMVPMAHANDGGGSIRIPASNCGLVGLKPTRDRIPLAPLKEHWYGMSVVGFEARSVEDVALLMSVGADDDDLRDSFAGQPGRLRVAVSTKPVLPTRVHSDVKRVADATAGRLRALGHEVEQSDPPFPLVSPATTRYLAGIAQDAGERLERPERLQRRTKGFARIGNAIPRAALDWALRDDDTERMRPFFERHDVLLTPVSALPPVRAGQWEGLGAVRTFLGLAQTYPFALEWNLTGQPSISVPAGRSDDGLPIGMQLVGRHGEEATLLALAAQLEGELRWTDNRPPLS
jgi:amidase